MRKTTQEPLSLMREIYRSYKAEMAAVAAYTYGQILFEQKLPALSDLFASLSHAEMRHYHALGELLRDLGVSHALKTNLQDFSYRFEGNDEESLLSVARRFLQDRAREEKQGAAFYQQLSAACDTDRARRVLSALSREEAEHAAALESTIERLLSS